MQACGLQRLGAVADETDDVIAHGGDRQAFDGLLQPQPQARAPVRNDDAGSPNGRGLRPGMNSVYDENSPWRSHLKRIDGPSRTLMWVASGPGCGGSARSQCAAMLDARSGVVSAS